MKKKIKNKDIEGLLTSVVHLASYPMPGELTLAIIEVRKFLKSALENYNEAAKQIGESRCERDAQGNPISEYQKDEQGNEVIHLPRKLRFADKKAEKEALAEVSDLGNKLIEYSVNEFARSMIENLRNITPIQMEAIIHMIAMKENL